MKVTDFIVEFLISKGITDVFGYPGGVICHLIDSAEKYSGQIATHTNYHEQASAFAACGYAQESGKVGVAFSTSGPGATNLITGVANAYFDSIPTLFFTGQVDTYGLKGKLPIRQRGFQETDVVSMVKGVTKYAIRVDNPYDIKYELEKAYYIATQGNPGPVLIDLPADIQRSDIDICKCRGYHTEDNRTISYDKIVNDLNIAIKKASRPCFLVGNGVKQVGIKSELGLLINKLNIPTVFSMPAFDTLPYDSKYNFGFIGANGHRYGNFVLGKSDLIITLGTRLDLKQVGNNRNDFAKQAQIIRIDIDEDNFSYPVHENEKQIKADVKLLTKAWLNECEASVSEEWVNSCLKIKDKLEGYDDEQYTKLLCSFGRMLPNDINITVDVGQSEVWVAQQLRVKEGQSVHMSAGHGTMGYSLPAAIGSYYASRREVYSFNGDGGIQMNIQELQFLARESLPIKVIIINNRALGMIRGFQEANFNKNYTQTIEGCGYSTPDFKKIARAYGLEYLLVESENDLKYLDELSEGPSIIEIVIPVETNLKPNFGQNGLIQDQRPYLEREFFDELMQL